MDWQKIIIELTDRSIGGFTQAALAEICGCGQSTISEIGRGIISRPNADVGMKLLELRAKIINKEAA
jgi:transcriptional regulator with XRE-family HTH domain